MPRPPFHRLSRRRRFAVVLPALCASSSALLATSHAGGDHVSRMYTVAGIVTGMAVGGAVVLFRRSRSLCA